jgi:hypothetical protein
MTTANCFGCHASIDVQEDEWWSHSWEERPGKTDKPLYNVYKNGELVEENKPMIDAKANKLDGHTQFNKEEGDFEKFRVEEVDE